MILLTNLVSLLLLHSLTSPLQINLHLTDSSLFNQSPLCTATSLSPCSGSTPKAKQVLTRSISFCLTECPHKWFIPNNSPAIIHSHSPSLNSNNNTSPFINSFSGQHRSISSNDINSYLDQPTTERTLVHGKWSILQLHMATIRSFLSVFFRSSHHRSTSILITITEWVSSAILFWPMVWFNDADLLHSSGNVIVAPLTSCLDWSEICDGKVDCLDGGRDEEECWRAGTEWMCRERISM